jgi:SAM-dependent MidA family methyltransferase
MDERRVDLRRDPPTDLTDVGEDAGLVARIRDEIQGAGPMPFARFMELALYDPDGGYYRGADARPGRGGDFITAPELHPIFGATIGTGLHEIWERLDKPRPFVIREHGAGTGALALAVLGGLDDPAFRTAIRYDPVEVDPRRVTTFVER